MCRQFYFAIGKNERAFRCGLKTRKRTIGQWQSAFTADDAIALAEVIAAEADGEADGVPICSRVRRSQLAAGLRRASLFDVARLIAFYEFS